MLTILYVCHIIIKSSLPQNTEYNISILVEIEHLIDLHCSDTIKPSYTFT